MTDVSRWQVTGVSATARGMARSAAKKRGIGVGEWLDIVIRRRTDIERGRLTAPDIGTLKDLPADLLETLQGLERRVILKAAEVETLVAPLESSVDRLNERLRALAGEFDTGVPEGADTDGDHADPFFADGEPPSDDDAQIADAAVASDLNHLFDDGTHAGSASATGGPEGPKIAMPRRTSGSNRRNMIVAAAIVIVATAVVATMYQWATVSVTPDTTAQPAPVPPPPPAPPTGATPTAPAQSVATPPDSAPAALQTPAPTKGMTETVELETLQQQQSALPESDASDRLAASFKRPPPPTPADSPLAALYRQAVAGERRAQYDLAIFYIQGRDVPQDYAAAAYWLRQAAADGLAPAQYNLGVVYDLGLGGAKDPVEALLWFHAAAEQGHPRANYALGLAYAEGKGIPRDNVTARKWFGKAADAGVADSQLALGIMFDEGLGGDANTGTAYYWYRRAQIGGNHRAAARIAALGERLSARERTEIDDRASRDVRPERARPRPKVTSTDPSTPSVPAASQARAESKETVRAVQRLLAELGFDPGPADGDVGPRTRTAIEDYQRTLDLPVDGRVSADLLSQLRDITGVPPGN